MLLLFHKQPVWKFLFWKIWNILIQKFTQHYMLTLYNIFFSVCLSLTPPPPFPTLQNTTCNAFLKLCPEKWTVNLKNGKGSRVCGQIIFMYTAHKLNGRRVFSFCNTDTSNLLFICVNERKWWMQSIFSCSSWLNWSEWMCTGFSHCLCLHFVKNTLQGILTLLGL